MKRILFAALSLCVLLAAFASAEENEVRTWTSKAASSGKVFTASGYLKSVSDDGESVVLVISGKEKTVKVDRLSESDKEYIANYLTAKKLDAENAAENPFSFDTDNSTDPAQPDQPAIAHQNVTPQTAAPQNAGSQSASAAPQSAGTPALPREGELFTFFDEELPILKPVYGIYLGETIQGVSQRFTVHKNLIQRVEHDMGDLVKEYTIKYSDDLVKSLSVCAIQDRVYSVTLKLADTSYEQCTMIHNQMKAKYGPPLENDAFGFQEHHNILLHDEKDFVYVDYSNKYLPIRIQVDENGVYYRYAKMGELFEQRRSEFRADKVKDRF